MWWQGRHKLCTRSRRGRPQIYTSLYDRDNTDPYRLKGFSGAWLCHRIATPATPIALMTECMDISQWLMYERGNWLEFWTLLAWYGSEMVCFMTVCVVIAIAIACLLGCGVKMVLQLLRMRPGISVVAFAARNPQFVACLVVHNCLFLGTTILCCLTLFFLLVVCGSCCCVFFVVCCLLLVACSYLGEGKGGLPGTSYLQHG